jgi:hypothetical protein
VLVMDDQPRRDQIQAATRRHNLARGVSPGSAERTGISPVGTAEQTHDLWSADTSLTLLDLAAASVILKLLRRLRSVSIKPRLMTGAFVFQRRFVPMILPCVIPTVGAPSFRALCERVGVPISISTLNWKTCERTRLPPLQKTQGWGTHRGSDIGNQHAMEKRMGHPPARFHRG